MIDENETRDFETDLKASNDPELRKSWLIVLNKLFGQCDIQWKDNKDIQLGLGCDLTIRLGNTRRYSVELKTRRQLYLDNPNYLLEIVHQIYEDSSRDILMRKKEGWLYSSTADIIIIGTKINNTIVEACAFTLTPFKNEGYKEFITSLYKVWSQPTQYNNAWQITLNAMINKNEISKRADKFWYWREEWR